MNFNTKTLVILNIVLAAGILGVLFYSFNGPEVSSGKPARPDQTVRSFDMNRPFDFCGEAIPITHFDVMERLDREILRNVYYHSATIMAIKRANVVFPIIEPILKEEGVPDDMKYLAVAESNLVNAVSPAGARGIWQFMKGTGQQYGLEISAEVDERNHLEKSTKAACAFLKSLKNRLGSWALVAAAYNGGPERIRTEMANQRAASFYELNLAADETMQYLFRIVAIKEVMRNPEAFEYFVDPSHLYQPLPPHKEVEITNSVANFGDFAKQYGMSYRELKLYNPWLTDNKLTNTSGKTYKIKVKA